MFPVPSLVWPNWSAKPLTANCCPLRSTALFAVKVAVQTVPLFGAASLRLLRAPLAGTVMSAESSPSTGSSNVKVTVVESKLLLSTVLSTSTVTVGAVLSRV